MQSAGVLWWLSAGIVHAAQLSVGAQTAEPGSSRSITVSFAPQSDVVSGVQFDVEYEQATLSLSGSLGDAGLQTGKALYFADIAPNRKRFVVIGANRTGIPGGALVNLIVNVRAGATRGIYALTATGVLGTSPQGDAVAVSSASGSVTIPGGAAVSVQWVNGASFLGGALAPGEIFTVAGAGIGPAAPTLPASGSATGLALGGVSVQFDGTPAPLLFASANQINAIVPFRVAGAASSQMRVVDKGITTGLATVGIAAAAPGLFTATNNGTGGGAILNQDASLNTASHPAARGSVIVLYATGAGETGPPGVDAKVALEELPKPLLPVSVTIGGVEAEVLYAGAAPQLVAGVLQVNCRVPSSVEPGSAVAVVLRVGNFASQPGVTVAVE